MSDISIDSRYYNSLSRVFTPLVLDKIADQGSSDYLTEVLHNSELIDCVDLSQSFSSFLDDVYLFLSGKYRNEYLYKNEIAKEILCQNHSLQDSWMLNEFRVGKCRADVVILNGTSTVYEIKSQFDSYKRLDDQIAAYRNVFDQIYVVTSDAQAEQLAEELPEIIGVITITDSNSIRNIKPALSNKHNIKPDVLFDSLRKKEYLEIVERLYGFVPDVPNTQIFEECKELFCQQPPEVIHEQCLEVLKHRNKKKAIDVVLNEAPKSLYAYIINNAGNTKKLESLSSRYETKIGEIVRSV